ncbi:MAG: hypothetical protein JEZ07_11555 [Phycisphaerae bacterium]|nr:hypothetical protein [Phycisphaerae bacterium]
MNKINLINIMMLVAFFGAIVVANISVDDPVYQRLAQKYPELKKPDGIQQLDWRIFLRSYDEYLEASKTPLVFHGQVVDQDGKGVAGVLLQTEYVKYEPIDVIKIDKRRDYPMHEQQWIYQEIETDAEGKFEIDMSSSLWLKIAFGDTEEYCLPNQKKVFSFNYKEVRKGKYIGNADSPVVFDLWKYSGDWPYLVKYSGFKSRLGWKKGDGLIYFDLVNRKRSLEKPQQYDFTIEVDMDNNSIEMSVPEGGVTDAKTLFPFRAPDVGYVQNRTFVVRNTRLNDSGKSNIYVKSRVGLCHSYLELSYRFYGDECIVGAAVVLNPNRSTNLEDINYKVRHDSDSIPKVAGKLYKTYPDLVKPEGMPDSRWISKLASIKEEMEMNKPIDFYGRIVDRDGKSISDVQINASYKMVDLELVKASISNPDLKEPKYKSGQVKTKTDENGIFVIKDIECYYLGLEPSKPGYSFGYDNDLTRVELGMIISQAMTDGRLDKQRTSYEHPVDFEVSLIKNLPKDTKEPEKPRGGGWFD